MKNEPKKFYLQIGEHPELGFDFNELEGVTFSTDKINNNDLVYYSESEVLRLIKKHLDIAVKSLDKHISDEGFDGLTECCKSPITNIKIDLT